jgi:hypothetical protein
LILVGDAIVVVGAVGGGLLALTGLVQLDPRRSEGKKRLLVGLGFIVLGALLVMISIG